MSTAMNYINLTNIISSVLEAQSNKKTLSYPPTDIIKLSDQHYQLHMALAGYTLKDVSITFERGGASSHCTQHFGDRNLLRVEGSIPKQIEKEGATYLQRGIARRTFVHSLVLDRFIEVASAKLENGMLIIDLDVVKPEENQPRKIEITG